MMSQKYTLILFGLIILVNNIKLKTNKIMKNIHVIPTDKPRTYKGGKVSTFTAVSSMMPTEFVPNIYITSDEEIKRYGEYYLDIDTNEVKTSFENMGKYSSNEKKIILTTDQDLIKEGVQKIDDEFLEWFVKNPNCESVEVEHTYISRELNKPTSKYYKIILPKEEPKQLTDLEIAIKLEEIQREEPKQETIREVVKRYYEDNIDESNIPREHYEWEIQDLMIGFAYQWQQERMYSEEEVLGIIIECSKWLLPQTDEDISKIKQWFEKYKNK
jgi:hypothetical protein